MLFLHVTPPSGIVAYCFSIYREGSTALNVRRRREIVVMSNLLAVGIKSILVIPLILN